MVVCIVCDVLYCNWRLLGSEIMAIILRTVEGIRVAVCPLEVDSKPGDVSLDDGDHRALTAKFEQDRKMQGMSYVPMVLEWRVMDKERVRPACGDDE